MAKIVLTREIAHAIARDAANAQMRKAGRMKWSIEDYNLAARTVNELFDRIEASENEPHS